MHLLLNYSMALIPAASTHVIKVMEPMVTAGIVWLAVGLTISRTRLLAVVLVVIGAIGATWDPLSTSPSQRLGMQLALLSNILYGSRNVLIKHLLGRNVVFHAAAVGKMSLLGAAVLLIPLVLGCLYKPSSLPLLVQINGAAASSAVWVCCLPCNLHLHFHVCDPKARVTLRLVTSKSLPISMQTYEFWVATRSHPTTFLDDFIMAEPVCCAVATMTNPPAFSHSTSENLKYTRRRSTFIGRRRSRNRKRLLLQLMSTVLLLSPAVQPYLRSPRRFWCFLVVFSIPAFPSSFLPFYVACHHKHNTDTWIQL